MRDAADPLMPPLDPNPRRLSRRGLLRLARAVAVLPAVPAALRLGAAAGALALTPSRADADEVATPPTVEGPYFKPRSHERAALREADTRGGAFSLSGRVLSTKGAPVEKALVDVWQADGDGAYDLDGFRLRGHQLTGADGVYRVDSVIPGYYPGRTRHIHVKVQAPGRPVLTTQLFFPNDPRNRGDGLYSTWLRMRVEDGGKGGGLRGTFTFVVEA